MNYQKLGLHHLAEKINVIVEEEEVILWKNEKKNMCSKPGDHRHRS